MTDYLVGTGGWAYFKVPEKPPLKAYSEVFNFVEVNQTFYEYPDMRTVEKYHRTKDILHVQRLLGHKNIQNTLIYIDLETKFFGNSTEGFTTRVAQTTGEACTLIEAGFEYVTGEYGDGGKIFRKRK